MYKILIKYPSDKITNLYQAYGNSTTSTTGSTSFTEFETDDIDVLKSELIKLDKEHGFDSVKVIKEIDVNYTVEVTDTDAENTEPTDPNPDTPSGDNTEDENSRE